jgi:hypothetical protein
LEIAVPPPPKRLQFGSNGKESLVLIGVWKESPPSDPAKKHAVYAFIDNDLPGGVSFWHWTSLRST